nr:hypothetical protein [Corynebacterium lactis]
MDEGVNHPQLPELVSAYAAATNADDSLLARQLETVFAHHFYNPQLFGDPAAACDERNVGSFFRLVRQVAEALGDERSAHDAAMNWMVWASDKEDVAEYWRARARLASDEAERYVNFIAYGPSSIAAESEIPLISRMKREIASYRDLIFSGDCRGQEQPGEAEERTHRRCAKRSALIDALFRVERALMRVRRSDLAEELQQMIRKLPNEDNSEHIVLEKTLMEAAFLHREGKVVQAARMCASQLNTVGEQSVVSGILLRRNLAVYSIETGNADTAFRMLSNNIVVADAHQLDLDHVLAVRDMGGIDFEGAQAAPSDEELLAIARRAHDVAWGFPECDVTMEVALLTATELFAIGDYEAAQPLSERVASWSENTSNYQRTDTACAIAAASALELADMQHSAVLYDALADLRSQYAASESPAETLMNAAMELSNAGAESAITATMMERSREFVADTWESAKWHEAMALLRWADWDDEGVYGYANSAAGLFLDVHAPSDAARVLSVAVRAAAGSHDVAAAESYAARIDELIAPSHPLHDEVHALLAEARAQ